MNNENSRRMNISSYKRIERKARLLAFGEWAGKAGLLMFAGFIGLVAAGEYEKLEEMAVAGTLFSVGWGIYGAKNREGKYLAKLTTDYSKK